MSVDCFMALQDPLLYCRTFVISVTTTAAGYPSCIAILYGTIYANLRYSFLLVEICYAGYSGTSVPREPWCFPYTAYGSTAPPAPLPYLVYSPPMVLSASGAQPMAAQHPLPGTYENWGTSPTAPTTVACQYLVDNGQTIIQHWRTPLCTDIFDQ